MIVVSDTSPLTNLMAIDKLDLLRQFYIKIIIPKAGFWIHQGLYDRVLQAAGESVLYKST